MENLYTLEEFDLPKELFGDYIGQGKDHNVYSYTKDNTKVIKILKNPYTNKAYMFNYIKQDRFNDIPCSVKKDLLGYITIKNKYYPVWIQDRTTNLLTTNDKEIYKQLSNIMIDNGFFPRCFVSPDIKISDLHPGNLAYDGDIKIIDCFAFEIEKF